MPKVDDKNSGLPAVIESDRDRQHHLSQAIGAGIIGAGAAIAGVVNPVLGILVGGMAPFVQKKIEDIALKRITTLRRHLDENGVDFEEMEKSDARFTPEKVLLIQEAIAAALGTDRDEKVAIIVRLLKMGLEADIESEVLAAKRFARTVARLDEVELRVILALHAMKVEQKRPATLPSVTADSKLGNPDLVRSALSSLQSEGLVRLGAGAVESWSITDFGHRLVLELAQVFPAE